MMIWKGHGSGHLFNLYHPDLIPHL